MMWVKRDAYITLIQKRTEADADASHYHIRLNEAKDEINRLRHELELERARANAAVDTMLVGKGHLPITPSEVPNPDHLFEEDPDEVKRMTQAIATDGLVAVLDEAR